MEAKQAKLLLNREGDFVTDVTNALRGPLPSEVPENIARWCALALLAACLQRRVWVTKPIGTRPQTFPNLYVLVVAPTGSYKSSCIKKVSQWMRMVPDLKDEDCFLIDGKMTATGLYDKLNQLGKTAPDGQPVPPYLWLLQDEIALHFGMDKFAQQLVRSLTAKFHGEAEGDLTRTSGQSVIKRGYCINWIGGTTEAWMQGMIGPAEIEGGFLGRVIVIEEPRCPVWIWQDEPPTDRDHAIAARAREYLDMHGEMNLTPEVLAWLKEWYVDRPQPEAGDHFAPRDFEMILKLLVLSAASGGRMTPAIADCERARWWLGRRKIPKCLLLTKPMQDLVVRLNSKDQVLDILRQAAKPILKRDLLRSLTDRPFNVPAQELITWFDEWLDTRRIKLVMVPVGNGPDLPAYQYQEEEAGA